MWGHQMGGARTRWGPNPESPGKKENQTLNNRKIHKNAPKPPQKRKPPPPETKQTLGGSKKKTGRKKKYTLSPPDHPPRKSMGKNEKTTCFVKKPRPRDWDRGGGQKVGQIPP